MHDVLSGLNYLHDLDIIHGDIKPQNILLRKVKKRVNHVIDLYFEGILSDFGLSLEIDEGRRSKTAHDNLIGSDGWRAKEILLVLEKANKKSIKNKSKIKVKGTKAVDIFSFGCIMQYVMTEKSNQYFMHPFGDIDLRNRNIKAEERKTYLSLKGKSSKPNLDDILADMLIEVCVLGNPELRPTTTEIAKNKFFWDAETKIQFLERVFNDLKSSKDPEFRESLEDNWSKYHKWVFVNEVPEAFKYDSKHNVVKPRNPYKVYNFLSLIRNTRQHYQEIVAKSSKEPTCKALSDCLGQGGDDDFSKYFLDRVVAVLPVVYLSFIKHPRSGSYQSYYSREDLNDEVFVERIQYQWATLDKVLIRRVNESGQVQRRSRTPSGQGSSRTPKTQGRSQTPNVKGRSKTPSGHGK